MFVETFVISILIAVLRKGSLKNLEKTRIKAFYLFIIGLLIQYLPFTFRLAGLKSANLFTDKYYKYFYLVSFLFVLTCLLLNIGKRSIQLIFVGTLLNLIVIFANGGSMPVSVDGLRFSGFPENRLSSDRLDLTHILMGESTKLGFLSDIIPVPKPYPFPKMLSIGDLLIVTGVFLFFQEEMVN